MENVRVVKCEQWGRYTIAEAVNDKGIKGIGMSRRSFRDKINDDLGRRIAEGRAIEAIRRKETKRNITSNFMG